MGHHPYWCVAVITISLGFNGASTLTNLQNAQDLAPNFAGTLYGVINFIGTTTGFLTPMVVGYFTKETVCIGRYLINKDYKAIKNYLLCFRTQLNHGE